MVSDAADGEVRSRRAAAHLRRVAAERLVVAVQAEQLAVEVDWCGRVARAERCGLAEQNEVARVPGLRQCSGAGGGQLPVAHRRQIHPQPSALSGLWHEPARVIRFVPERPLMNTRVASGNGVNERRVLGDAWRAALA